MASPAIPPVPAAFFGAVLGLTGLPTAVGEAVMAVATLLMALAALPYSRSLAWALIALGLVWNLFYSLWHTGQLWQGGR